MIRGSERLHFEFPAIWLAVLKGIYLDHHATTPMDPLVFDAMLPWMREYYANPGSTTHEAGRYAKQQIELAIASIGHFFGATADDVVITSGATESNNLAVFGICLHPRQKRRKIVSVTTEHHAMLGPLRKLERQGFEVEWVPVLQHPSADAGMVDLQKMVEAIDERTALVSVMLANNEIGVVQPLTAIVERCVRYGVVLHTDASQAVGRLDVNIADLGVDLLSFSAHKIYGPKGVGGLILSSARRNQRLAPQIVGGGQQNNLRSGTLNTTGIIGLAKSLEVALQRREVDVAKAWALRSRLWQSLSNQIDGLRINGPEWNDCPPSSDGSRKELQKRRLAANLNICFPKVDGQSLMLEAPALAVSSGSACTSANPEASHVLLNIGRNEDEARGSIRFGIGRFNTETEIDHASEMLIKAYRKLAVFVA